MEPLIIGAISLIAILFLILLGVPIAFALGSIGIFGMALLIGFDRAAAQIARAAFSFTSQYMFAVVPLFITIGVLATVAEMTGPVFNSARLWLARLKGGLAMATCLASGAFAACSGSTVANAAIFTPLALPEMLKYGYDKRLAAGCIAASGTFAAMIPPSITMVIYGIITGEPIGKLLIAGVIPGIITVIIYMISIYLRVMSNPELAPSADLGVTWGEKFRSLKDSWGIVFIFSILLLGIYTGWFAPSAAGAVGGFAALVLVVVKRKMSWKSLKTVSLNVLGIQSSLFIIMIGGFLFSRFWVMSGVVNRLGDFVNSLEIPSIFIIITILLMLLVLGCIMDPPSMMIVSLPMIYPIVIKMGYNGIWFGILIVKMTEIAVITPPVGFNCFVVQTASDGRVTLNDVFSGIVPFLAMDIVTLAILVMFPQITLWLPNTMN